MFGVSDLLKRSSPSRIVIVASIAHILGTLDLDDLNFVKSFGGDKVYCSSKLANILMSSELAKKLKGTGNLFMVFSYCTNMHSLYLHMVILFSLLVIVERSHDTE
jgi:NAD(P)-dependent dehydrogenase (short-subunit alcohol dehydrogenase family)